MIEMVEEDPVGSIRLAGNYIFNNGTVSAKEEPVQSCPVVVVDELRSISAQVLPREQSMLVQGIIQVQSVKTLPTNY